MRPEAPGDRDRIEHMLQASRDEVAFCAARTRADLDTDVQLRRATLHALPEIGEAARCVSADGRARIMSVDWPAISGMRNVIVHVYWGVRLNVVWSTVQDDLPGLINSLEQSLALWPGSGDE